MEQPRFYFLSELSVVDVTGADADVIIHNLTTNDVKAIEPGKGCETFVTDVRGKTLGHYFVFRREGGLRFIGPPGQSERLVEHVDRYTIREDATAVLRDAEFNAIVIPPAAANDLTESSTQSIATTACRIGDSQREAVSTRWLGEGTLVLLSDAEQIEAIARDLEAAGLSRADAAAFHQARTLAGFPWYGIDLDDSNLPQEADRDELAISFTKGCYLGQETVARLDALGQVQKKLVRWSISGTGAQVGGKLVSGEKTVGRLTSLATDGQGQITAIGYARRSHFDAGSQAEGVNEGSGERFVGVVV